MSTPSLPPQPKPPSFPTPKPPPPDKLSFSAHYDDKTGVCTSLDVHMNFDGISREDIVDTIRTLFRPGGKPGRPLSDYTLSNIPDAPPGETAVLVFDGEPIGSAATTTRMPIPKRT